MQSGAHEMRELKRSPAASLPEPSGGRALLIGKALSGSGRTELSMVLALSLPLMRISRALAQEENQLDYSHEFYRENDNRISVDTDTVHFDVGLRPNIRLNGDVVIDAISGATPTGAPPQTMWPFPNFANFYHNAYNQIFQNAVNDPNNLVLYESGLFATYQDYTNYVAANNPQIPAQATNTANLSYQGLTNNPNLKNTSVPLTQMHDRRTAFSLRLPITMGRHEITPSISYSEESDYVSWGGALNYTCALNNKNTKLSLGWAHTSDNVRDATFVWENKNTDSGFAGLVQLLGPKSYLTLNCTLTSEHGYLSDPYRGVMLQSPLQLDPSDAALIPENRPRHRNSQAVYVSWTQFVTPLYGSVELNYRFFHDTYGIIAHTIEFDWHQKVGEHLVISPVCRYYVQSSANFYYLLVPDYYDPGANEYKPKPSYYSSDYRLSHFQSIAGGVSVMWRVHKHVSLNASYLRYVMEGLDGVTSQSAYPSANITSIGLSVWF